MPDTCWTQASLQAGLCFKAEHLSFHNNTQLFFTTMNTVFPADRATGTQEKGQRRKMKCFHYFCGHVCCRCLMLCSHRLWRNPLKSGGISPIICPCLKFHLLKRLESSSWGHGKPKLRTQISADTAALQNAQFILSVKKKTDGEWGKHKEVRELRKTDHMKDNRRKRHMGRITLQS